MPEIEFIVGQVRILSGLSALCLLLAGGSCVRAQSGFRLPPMPSGVGPPPRIFERYPDNPSSPPSFTIGLGPLGFSIPGKNYFLRHQSLVSLDFLDEDRILFTFRVSGLLQRDADENSGDKKQQIQALVLSLSSGKVESRATWIVPDRSRYLWMLDNRHFLLRVPDGLDEGDAQLQMKPYLRLPGRLLWIEMDPGKQVMITNALEPASLSQLPNHSGPIVTEPPAAATDQRKLGEPSVLVARTAKVASGQVMLVSRTQWTSQASDWPMNSEGYVEDSRDGANRWLLKLIGFSGGERELARVESTCSPQYGFLSETELLLSACDPQNGWILRAMLSYGVSLWESRIAMNAIFPLLVIAPNGSRVARETLLLKHPVDRYKRLIGARDFQGQVVKVFDAADGKIVLESPSTPMFDGGGNVAISPSGQRVAIVDAGAIQVFQLPVPLPAPGSR